MKRFLIISDIHATDVDPSSSSTPSYVSTHKSEPGKSLDPITELEALIKNDSLAPDCILCAGDITNKSKPEPFSYAWTRLQALAQSYDLPIYATVGNHDLDSRYSANEYDPRGFAMSLQPKIPCDDRTRYLEYWAENVTHVAGDDYNILILNTAGFHGAGKNAASEIQHGRISAATIKAIKEVTKKFSKTAVNLLLCHHHVIKPEKSDTSFSGQTRGASELLELLNESENAWIIIHGHKHIPELYYGYGGANAPVVLGCASFSAQINEDAQNKCPNQVHLLICEPDVANNLRLSSAGTVLSWTWQPGVGWARSGGPGGLPHTVGFGHRAGVTPLVDDLERALTSSGVDFLTWVDASQAIPLLARLVPGDFRKLKEEMRKKNLAFLMDDGRIAQVGRAP